MDYDTDIVCENCYADIEVSFADGEESVLVVCPECKATHLAELATVLGPAHCAFCGAELPEDNPCEFCPTCCPPSHDHAG